ncbi:flagellar biosynthesis protein FlgE [Tabrizicola sp. TH137]|uniref:flagellar hook protein FlgE n=1 Tax=Tabrizicola sp. TH137 TaxID=2067452 RepID=UPI000C797646|nr:flagellar hook-basal body complex protein [Tabrizicola sp. TH137]PLL14602.1 flagellar biosynthesis protein FlgE [Tabrizicola sp. TH137]
MSISSSLNAGVAGLNANATRLATISDNIANSSTFGYRRAEADFESLMLGDVAGSGGKFSAGGVRASTIRLLDETGPLVSTGNALDIAISGRGMLPVRPQAGDGVDPSEMAMQLTRTGSFRADEEGFLSTASGLVLLGWPVSLDGSVPDFPRESDIGLVPVRIDTNQRVGDATTRVNLGVNLPANNTTAGGTGDALPLSIEYFDNLGAPRTLEFSFTPTIPASGSSNTWTLQITDPLQANAVIGEFTLEFDASRGSGGALDTVSALSAGSYDAATGMLSVNLLGGPLDIYIGAPGDSGGLTQLSDGFAPIGITKNGSPVGTMTGLEIDDEGFIQATYDTGFTRRLYQIPLVDVPNINGLRAVGSQTYQISPQSGAFTLWDAGTGPVGTIEGFSREGSTTDVAAELTALIETQRAYSSNAKVIQTVDEMLQETTNIKR